MKKLLLALLAVAGVFAVAPQAEAGQFVRVYTDCGVTYVPKVALYGDSYRYQVARNNHCRPQPRPRFYRESFYGCRPARPVYFNNFRGCSPHRAPRFAFSFGF